MAVRFIVFESRGTADLLGPLRLQQVHNAEGSGETLLRGKPCYDFYFL